MFLYWCHGFIYEVCGCWLESLKHPDLALRLTDEQAMIIFNLVSFIGFIFALFVLSCFPFGSRFKAPKIQSRDGYKNRPNKISKRQRHLSEGTLSSQEDLILRRRRQNVINSLEALQNLVMTLPTLANWLPNAVNWPSFAQLAHINVRLLDQLRLHSTRPAPCKSNLADKRWMASHAFQFKEGERAG